MDDEFFETSIGGYRFRVKRGFFYTLDGLWVEVDEARELVRIGIVDCTDREPVAYVEFPERGMTLNPGEDVAGIERSNQDNWPRLPFGGTVLRINEAVEQTPNLVSCDPYGDGWLVEVRPDEWPLVGLLEPQAYLDMLRCRTGGRDTPAGLVEDIERR